MVVVIFQSFKSLNKKNEFDIKNKCFRKRSDIHL